jgi:hypothetical protein
MSATREVSANKPTPHPLTSDKLACLRKANQTICLETGPRVLTSNVKSYTTDTDPSASLTKVPHSPTSSTDSSTDASLWSHSS